MIATVDGTAVETGEETKVGNYLVTTATGTLTIDRITDEVTVTIRAHGGQFTYNARNHTVTGYDVVSIDHPLYTEDNFLFSGTASVTVKDAVKTNMGLNASDFTNISDNFANVTFLVTKDDVIVDPKPVTITVDDKAKTYGDKDPVLTARVNDLEGNDTVVLTVTRVPGDNAGTYTITATAEENKNYIIPDGTGTLTINRKDITVTADDKVKVFGAADPTLTATISGLVTGDSTDLIQYKLSRAAGNNVGTYEISVSGEAIQGNYNVAYVPGTLTIATPDTVIVRITANSGTFLYDGTERNLSGYTVTTSNPLYGENSFTFSGSSDLRAVNAGTYRTNMTAADFVNNDRNFANVLFEVTNGTLTINQRHVTLTSASAEKTYDGTPLKNTYITVGGDGFAPNEGLIYNVTGTITNPGTAENTFEWTAANGTLLANYAITKQTGTLTVMPSETHKLHIIYVTSAGTVIGNFEKDYAAGERYEVVTPRLDGFYADTATVSGIMGDADVEVTVVFSQILHTLTVHYVAVGENEDLTDPTILILPAGADYRVNVPEIEGYESLISVVTGVMPNGDREITVMMVGDEARKILGNNPVIIIEDDRTPLGINNAVLGGGEIIE